MKRFKLSRKHLAIPYAIFLILFVVLPLLIIVYYAFTVGEGSGTHFSFDNFKAFFTSRTNSIVFARSILIGVANTALCILIGYPIAYMLANKNNKFSYLVLLLFIMPMWINFVLRTGATRDLLSWIGINSGNYPYLSTMIGMVYNYLPFSILPLYSTMLKMDKSQIEASYDLGANKTQTFFKTIIPMTMPGIVSATTMVFMPTMSSYVISDIMSGYKISIIGNLIEINFSQHKWGPGSFISLVMFIIILLIAAITKKMGKSDEDARVSLW